VAKPNPGVNRASNSGWIRGTRGRLWRRWLVLGAVGSLVLAGCDRSAVAPEDSTTPPTAAPETINPTPEAAPTASPDPIAQAPNQVPANPTAQLPDTLVKQWEPISNVLVAFGTMTVTPSEVTWSSGQSSPYTLVSTEGGFLLKLETSPKFYDTPNPFIKLIPETNETGAVTSIEVAFYDSEAQLQKDEYIMYGSYFVN